jgi:hypothetical protein
VHHAALSARRGCRRSPRASRHAERWWRSCFFHENNRQSGATSSRGHADAPGEHAKPVFVFWRDSSSAPRNSEVRGEFWDVGRLERTDSRFSNVNFQPILDAASNGQWPAREQVFMILGASAVESPLPPSRSIRALALAPEQYVGKGVTVTGRFRGANLFADLPRAPARRAVGLRAAVGRRGDLGHGRPPRGAASISTSTRGWTRALAAGGRHRAAATARCRGSTRRPIQRRRRPTERRRSRAAAAAAAAAAAVVFSTPTAGETDADRDGADPHPVLARHGREDLPRTRRSRTPAPRRQGARRRPAATVRYVEGNRALEIKLPRRSIATAP